MEAAAKQDSRLWFIRLTVHLGAPGGFLEDWLSYDATKIMSRELAVFIPRCLGVMIGEKQQATRSMPFFPSAASPTAAKNSEPNFSSSARSSPHLVAMALKSCAACLPIYATLLTRQRFTQMLPQSVAEAQEQVDALNRAHVDGIKAVMEAGAGGLVFNRMDPRLLNAVAAQSRADNLPIVVHTGDVRDVEDALKAGVNGIEHGSFRERIPDADFALAAKNHVTWATPR